MPLSEITAERVDRYAHAKRREGKLSANSVNKTLHYLSTILDLAVDYERIPRNPAKGKKRRLPGEPRRRSWVGPEQLIALLDASNPTFRPLVATLAGGGLRIGEAVALTWADVNLASGTIRVTDAKTAAGVRTVDMPYAARPLLRAARVQGPQQHGQAERSDLPQEADKGPQNIRNAQSRLKHAVKLANIELAKTGGIEPISETVTPHSLRRAYASLRLGAGDDPVYVAEQLGHTRATFSMDVYARAIKRRDRLVGEQRKQPKAFDAALEWAAMGSSADLAGSLDPGIPHVERVSDPKRG